MIQPNREEASFITKHLQKFLDDKITNCPELARLRDNAEIRLTIHHEPVSVDQIDFQMNTFTVKVSE